MRCDGCGQSVVRVRRARWERLVYALVYKCPECERKTKVPRYPLFHALSLHRSCPRCGNLELERLRKRDGIDPLYLNPISLVQALIGAPIWWCPFCRLQFYDARPGWPVTRSSSK
jgi:predicted RNA-binding Zn-ribbon protein involved in translation (DUF1610 family)